MFVVQLTIFESEIKNENKVLSFFMIKEFIPQIIGFVIGGIIAFIGMILDLIGEIILAKKYTEYNK